MNTLPEITAYVPSFRLTDVLPFVVMLVGALLCLVVDATGFKERSRKLLPILSAGTLLVALVSFFFPLMPERPFLEGMLLGDEFGQLGAMVMTFASIMVCVMGPRLISRRNIAAAEFYSLVILANFGMTMMAIANELLTAFICLELASLALYVLTGIDRRSARSQEASFKYFILGSFASAFLVMGIAFLYGATKTTYLSEMADVFRRGGIVLQPAAFREGGLFSSPAVIAPLNEVWVFVGFALMLVGLGFKLSLSPFHMWAPDVYEGAPTPTAMLIATASKVATLALFAHLVQALSNWSGFTAGAVSLIGFVAVLSMLWGNLAALKQSNIKRMLAFSSIAHTGYATVGVFVLAALPGSFAGGPEALATAQSDLRTAIIFYMAGYTLMNVLAFGIAHFVEHGEGDMASYRGLSVRHPVAALGMAVAMISLLGIPPTVGFMGKFYVFKEAVRHGFVEIAVVGVLASVISAFYYLRLVVTMYMTEEPAANEGIRPVGIGAGGGATMAIAGVGATRLMLVAVTGLIFLFGVLPGLFFGLERYSAYLLGGR